ncbi:hypothetical protein [Tahibacter amnicola]|uniref:Uncharacterized protein n=1 Tax=Tahibacter amnicola TaxID=2976241 RepID=A0ABY6BJD0_9GAMM|nr:hypothetical protein [Tahibacter amnicola]UXI70118.1 hypothetical protein N4264_10955 [Tahibacter amnicola]
MEARRLRFWQLWLFGVTMLTVVFGLALMVAPVLARHGFSWLFYGSPFHIDTFGEAATRYITFIHGALGAAIFGWGIVLAFVAHGPFANRSRLAWSAFAASLFGWFVPDVLVSLAFGFWQNVALDAVFFVLYVAPLLATWKIFWRPASAVPATA